MFFISERTTKTTSPMQSTGVKLRILTASVIKTLIYKTTYPVYV